MSKSFHLSSCKLTVLYCLVGRGGAGGAFNQALLKQRGYKFESHQEFVI